MYNPAQLLDIDRTEAAKRERAKQWEEERRPRIFNARQRLLGVDLEALNRQVEEKKALKQQERDQENAFVKKIISDNNIADQFKRIVSENKRKTMQDVIKFREVFQKKEDSREFDLNDPNALRNSLPCRLLDDDPRISISSVQRFEGEDGVAKARKKVQMEQQQSWLMQQMAERRRQEKDKEAGDRLYFDSLKAQEDRAIHMENQYAKLRREMDVATFQFNQSLAIEKAANDRMERLRLFEDNKQEVYNSVNSDFLTENPDVAQSSLGINKMIGSCYKGMTKEQKEEIKKVQMKQIEEIKNKRKEEADNVKYWEDMSNTIARKKYVEEMKMEAERKERLKKMLDENKRLMEEQRAHKEYLNKVVYTNIPTAAYYDQFNKSTR